MRVGFAMSGNNSASAVDTRALLWTSGGATDPFQGSATFYVSGLTAGSTTFTLKYKTSANTATFLNRSLIVIPLVWQLKMAH